MAPPPTTAAPTPPPAPAEDTAHLRAALNELLALGMALARELAADTQTPAVTRALAFDRLARCARHTIRLIAALNDPKTAQTTAPRPREAKAQTTPDRDDANPNDSPERRERPESVERAERPERAERDESFPNIPIAEAIHGICRSLDLVWEPGSLPRRRLPTDQRPARPTPAKPIPAKHHQPAPVLAAPVLAAPVLAKPPPAAPRPDLTARAFPAIHPNIVDLRAQIAQAIAPKINVIAPKIPPTPPDPLRR